MDYSKLEAFSSEKKKSDLSKAKKEEFVRVFTELLKEEQYSKNSEKYFFSCFSIVGTDCLYDYLSSLNSNEERNAFLCSIISTEKFRMNEKNIAYRISLGLLSIIINKSMTYVPVFGRIICSIPIFAKNKEGKYCADRDSSFAKYFVGNISDKAQLPELPFGGVTIKAMSDFVEFVQMCAPSLSENKGIKASAVEKINAWVANIKNPQSIVPNDVQPTSMSKPQDNTNESASKEPNDAGKKDCAAQSVEEPNEACGAQSVRKAASDVLLEIGQRLISGAGVVKEYERSIAQKQETIIRLKSRISELEKEKTARNECIENRTKEIANLQKQVEELITQNSDLIQQIHTMKSVDSVYTNAKENELTETLNEIASRLVCDYNDFIAAKNVEMTLDLGENFRYQLKEIFKKLKKAGIDVEGLSNA